MVRLVGIVLLAAALAGCFAPGEQVAVRNWRPLGPGGLTLGQLLAVSPCCKAVTWESYVGAGGATMVRTAVEYDPVRAAGGCPMPGAGRITAARVFLLLEFAVTPAGGVTFVAARGQAYSARGYFEEYPLDIGVMADIAARAFPLPCPDISLPDYL
jgi:hypothetical protein